MNAMQRLELRQGQSLTMTPQLVQSIKLLQLSHAELASYVAAELERNPLLQEGEIPADAPGLSLADFLRAKQKAQALGPRIVPGPSPLRSSPSSGASGPTHGEIGSELGETLARAASLTEHLEAQLDLATSDPHLRMIGEHLIHSLDEAGYLREDLAEIAVRLGTAPADVESALQLIQTFEPAGVGARDLAECLAIQLKELGRLDPAMQALLGNLNLVARQDFAALKKVCGVGREDLAAMLAEIRRLEPKPGLAFTPAAIDVLVPDVLVRPAPDGSLAVELNPETMPHILLNRTYYAEVAKVLNKEEDKSFLSECVQAASWLTRSLEQRARTILKVAAEIARHQEEFFRQGVSGLRPLTLKSVADAIGMHESTISRVAANKAIGTERGTYPMKFFFGAATGEGEHAAKAVRHRIGQMIGAEKPEDVLSDEAIAQKLKLEGIQVARRTVAKYRDALRIPSSSERRRLGREA
ncbi:RNA polymerase factor sigma-54 [Microvirga soli]|uniref:RNA polymerase factor sigma-54 n=1 Tax=Microvirga soli TaxID=1854496 RepID=UPI00191D705E|nr:RNA polymerase factor sigma-54 [Microvirga soli]